MLFRHLLLLMDLGSALLLCQMLLRLTLHLYLRLTVLLCNALLFLSDLGLALFRLALFRLAVFRLAVLLDLSLALLLRPAWLSDVAFTLC